MFHGYGQCSDYVKELCVDTVQFECFAGRYQLLSKCDSYMCNCSLDSSNVKKDGVCTRVCMSRFRYSG